jgi:hypothetical protein
MLIFNCTEISGFCRARQACTLQHISDEQQTLGMKGHAVPLNELNQIVRSIKVFQNSRRDALLERKDSGTITPVADNSSADLDKLIDGWPIPLPEGIQN